MPGLLIIFMIFAGSGAAKAASIPAARDNTLFESLTGDLSSGSGPGVFTGNNSGSQARRALLLFDVAAHIPPGATVTSAELQVHVSSAPNETPQTVTVHRVLSDWGEGSSISNGGRGAPAQTGDATWIHTHYSSSFWTTPGGDFDAAVSAAAVLGEAGFHSWSGPGLVADVQSWLDGETPNFGWLLLGNEAEAATARRIDSREHVDQAKRPMLTIEIETPTGVEVDSWGAVKSRFRTVRTSGVSIGLLPDQPGTCPFPLDLRIPTQSVCLLYGGTS